MADLILAETAAAHRPRNVDWKRAAALLYGDWGTSKAYVIGLAFVAAGFALLCDVDLEPAPAERSPEQRLVPAHGLHPAESSTSDRPCGQSGIGGLEDP